MSDALSTPARTQLRVSVLVKEISTFRSIDSEALFKDDDGPVPSKELYFPVIDRLKFADIRIVGSCNGLICLLFGWCIPVIMLWNPCTRESKVLPKPPLEDHSLFCPFFGFGYDSTTDDYKVIVGNFRGISRIGSGYEDIVLYTVITGSWRKLQRLNHKLFGYGCLVNGALHWVWLLLVIANKLMSFDLTEDKFHEIAYPYYPIPIGKYRYLIASEGKFRNSLFSYSRGPGLEFNMWVMKEAGVEKSWNEVIKIQREVLPVPADHDLLWSPLCISNDGVTLIIVRDAAAYDDPWFLTLYNPKEN
ncbi:PREDICTED: F-box/kelch-repeat protein At3g06240-like [Fragaria vesca subsp. vesca]|uniref:F-box/kelch-repeat protein At3g06240-like n=1 Tax=Fragaria vesca subsp. vesca TaxID=101020 RepID=UPI0002C359C9|nr:PREDICTED: F-box/kelch-repeat protein At3g06240-like [Fragaria vesca subsp. vesca]